MKTNILITAVNAAPGRSVYNSLKKNKNLKIISVTQIQIVFLILKVKDFYNCPKANKKVIKILLIILLKTRKSKLSFHV